MQEPQPATTTTEVEAAWRFFFCNWIVIAAMGVALALGLSLMAFSIGLSGLAIVGVYVGIYSWFAYANARSPTRRDPQVMFVLGATAQLTLITAVMTPLTYVAAATNLPLQDANLLAVDKALGFDWRAYIYFVDGHPDLAAWLSFGYIMIGWQLFAVPLVLAAKGRFRCVEEFVFAFGVALIVTTIISALVPAIGVYQQIGLDPASLKNLYPGAYLDQLRDLEPTREGALRHLQLLGLSGIVTFPSFHAASAVLFVWGLWPSRWMRPVALLANSAMLAATPIIGGHYLADVIAGMAIAALAIVAARQVGRIIARRSVGSVVATPSCTAIVPGRMTTAAGEA